MALPPAWIHLLEALNATAWVTGEPERAQAIAKYLEAHGSRVVPSYAVNEAAIPVGLHLDEDVEAAFAAADATDEPDDTGLTLEEIKTSRKSTTIRCILRSDRQ